MKRLLLSLFLLTGIVLAPTQRAAAQEPAGPPPAGASTSPSNPSGGLLFHIAQQAFVLLSKFPDEKVIEWARDYLKATAGPLAVKNFDHYLDGTGTTVPVDVGQLLANDDQVLKKIQDAIKNRTTSSGTVKIAQPEYANYEYRCTLGGISVDWSVDANGTVRLSIKKRYHWSPNNPAYIDQAIHQVLEAQKTNKKKSAQEFWIEGSTSMSLKALLNMDGSARITYDENAPKAPANPGPTDGPTRIIYDDTAPRAVPVPTPTPPSPRGSAVRPTVTYTPVPAPAAPVTPARSGSVPTITAPAVPFPAPIPAPTYTPSPSYGTSASVPPAPGSGGPTTRIVYDDSAPRAVVAPKGVTMRVGIDRGTLKRAESPTGLAAAIRSDK
jgi:hypothetical protein